jgi:energy-coupling factor transport system ATP-binding protein
MDPLITLEHVSYTYPDRDEPALRSLDLEIYEGQSVALVGANGSGKTTLARLLNALLLPTAGRVLVANLDTADPRSRDAVHTLVGMVFQNPADQVVASLVEEDVAFGPENIGLPPHEIAARVEEALREVDLWDLRQRPPHFLSAGQTQRLALAGVLAMRPRCIIFDEATAMLDPAGRRTVRAWMDRLHREGLTVIFITHFMDEAARADRVIALHRGQVALDGPPAVVFADRDRLETLGLEQPPAARLAERLRSSLPTLPGDLLTTESLLAALPAYTGPQGSPHSPDPEVPSGEVLMDVRHLRHIYLEGTPFASRALEDASLAVNAGEPHGLLGATGAGKSTLLQHLNGLLRPQAGSVRVLGLDLSDPNLDIKSVRRRVGLVFQNPELQFFEQYVGDEIAYGPRLAGVKDLAARVRWAMTLVGLDFDLFKDRLTFTLSGGERRKVALASTLALQPEILLLDEPTAGLDPVSRRELITNLQRLQAEGRAMVVSSHQMEDMAVLVRRLTVYRRGKDVLTGTTAEVFNQTAALAKAGLEPPLAAQAADRLRELGWPLPGGLVTPSALQAAVEQVRVQP